MTQEKKQEYTRRISLANPTDMIVIIYDILLSYINDAANAISAEDKSALNDSIVNIRKCINELIGSLNYEYSPSGELLSLYVFCSKQLTPVALRLDAGALESIRAIIERLRDAYSSIASYNKQGPVMKNSQSVYAGLTYGKGSLNENIICSENRGFLA